MRTLTALTALSALFALALLVGCPDNAPGDDAGPVDAASEERRDAGAPLDAGDDDAGDDEGGDAGGPNHDDAGPVDAGDGGAEDAGAPDAGFVCTLPPIEPPPPLDDDAGPPACTLVGVEGALGRFEGTWDGVVFGSFPISGPFELPARGEMAFDIYCGDDKLLVDGTLEGRAYQHPDAGPEEPGHPFSGRLYGEYTLVDGLITMVVKPATLTVGPFTGTFEVAMSGQRVNDSFEDGSWCGYTTSPAGGSGDGTWRAELR